MFDKRDRICYNLVTINFRRDFMAAEKIPLSYKGRPLRRKDNLIYYGTMAEKYIIMLQVLNTKKVEGLDVATKVAVINQIREVYQTGL